MPSYPLFDHLTRLDGVVPVPYALDFHGAWALDLHAIERALTPRTRAVCVVSPNNPTGSHLKRAELAALAALCRDRGVALLGDEVFFDYPLDAAGAPRASVLEQDVALSFSFGGLSKSAALPQLKLGWMAVGGPASLTARALERLELVADTYLSVSTPVQLAAAALFEAGNRLRPRIQARLAQNLATLRRLAGAYPACRVLPVEGGWSAVVQVPATRTEEELVLHLIEEDDVIVHPGYFFDFPCEAFVVVSLLVPPDEFDEGTRRMLARASA
jgi:aspartate/methionine/tyrosine aminotransferase